MNTREIGAEAENYTAEWLTQKGYEILDRNFCMRGGELDIIAKKDDTVVFVEVRSWNREFWEGGTPLETISSSKIKHLIKTAVYYLHTKKIPQQSVNIRFDVAALIKESDGRFSIDYIPAAFDASEVR
ncbi:YraN family protein [bacterium]|nr:YraN family protein [bacterium]